MTLIVEVAGPFQGRPWRFRSGVMSRVGWGPFALAYSSRSLDRLLDDARAGLTEWRGPR